MNTNTLTQIMRRLNLLERNQENPLPNPQPRPRQQLSISPPKSIVIDSQVEEKDNCCICLDELKDDKNLVIFNCGHKMDFSCYVRMVYGNNMNMGTIKCPLCRAKTISNDLIREVRRNRPNQRNNRQNQLNNWNNRNNRNNNFSDSDSDSEFDSDFDSDSLDNIQIPVPPVQIPVPPVQRPNAIVILGRRGLLSIYGRNSCKYYILEFLSRPENIALTFTGTEIRTGVELTRHFSMNCFRRSLNVLYQENRITMDNLTSYNPLRYGIRRS